MTQDKARKEAVRTYADQHNLTYTQALAHLGANANEPDSEQGPVVLPTVHLDRGAKTYSTVAFTGPDKSVRPHAYIVGETGTGKTHLMRSLAHQVVQGQGTVKVCDPKTVGWSDFIEEHQGESQRVEHTTTLDSIAALIESVRNEMRRRITRVASHSLQGDMDPCLLVIDEAQTVLENNDDDPQENRDLQQRMLNNIENILRQGRAVGIHLLIGSQRPIAALSSGASADNLATWTVPFQARGGGTVLDEQESPTTGDDDG